MQGSVLGATVCMALASTMYVGGLGVQEWAVFDSAFGQKTHVGLFQFCTRGDCEYFDDGSRICNLRTPNGDQDLDFCSRSYTTMFFTLVAFLVAGAAVFQNFLVQFGRTSKTLGRNLDIASALCALLAMAVYGSFIADWNDDERTDRADTGAAFILVILGFFANLAAPFLIMYAD